jgi:hypothetical protein
MATEPCNKPPTISCEPPQPPGKRRALHAIERARVLLQAYRKVQVDDPDGYVASIATVLAAYPAEVSIEVTSPVTGISAQEKFKVVPPNSGEVKAACDAVRSKHAAIDAMRAGAEKRGDVVVLPSAPNYGTLMAQAGMAKPYWEGPWRDGEGVLWIPKAMAG